MPRTALLDSKLLDPNKMGRQAEDIENQLRHFVVGQEESIQYTRSSGRSRLTRRGYHRLAGRSANFFSGPSPC